MASQKPIIVLIHGAFLSPLHYRKIIEPLRSQGYIVLSPPMATTGIDDSVAGKTYVDDVKRLLDCLLPYLDEGREAVVVGHSQGGIAASALTEGQTIEDRKAKGLKGGIKSVIYLTALAIPMKGASLLSILGGAPAAETQKPEEAPPNNLWAEQGPFYVLTESALSSMNSDFPISEEDHKEVTRSLMHQSKASLEAPIQFCAADVTVPKTYIVCTEDKSLPAPLQEQLAHATGCDIVRLPVTHFPFFESGDSSKKVVDAIVDAAGK
ncbi:alpha/beta-hydrolase [Daldinia caldariorum]|uniref:alpha/beta-hydrolase n=1 Tax=Daldinia caldariorum TaxID=326644 RepID=UPI002007C93C|nr:alpha/beta-hydrolase [Daldinia caldariorum]KAI1470713.1 alpha/beta-hydrolase [Daldinia caldariorum]